MIWYAGASKAVLNWVGHGKSLTTSPSLCRGGSRIFEKGGGVHLKSPSKKGGSRRGSTFGPNVKKPTSWAKKGGSRPHGPPGSAHVYVYSCLLTLPRKVCPFMWIWKNYGWDRSPVPQFRRPWHVWQFILYWVHGLLVSTSRKKHVRIESGKRSLWHPLWVPTVNCKVMVNIFFRLRCRPQVSCESGVHVNGLCI